MSRSACGASSSSTTARSLAMTVPNRTGITVAASAAASTTRQWARTSRAAISAPPSRSLTSAASSPCSTDRTLAPVTPVAAADSCSAARRTP